MTRPLNALCLLSLVFNVVSLDLPDYLKAGIIAVRNERCREDVEFYFKELEINSFWAVKMMDSSGKIPSGILYGSQYDFGHFDECLQVQTTNKNHEIFGKYCLTSIELKIDKNGSNTNDEVILRELGRFTNHSSEVNKLRIAACIPSTCSHEDLENHLQFSLSKVKYLDGLDLRVTVIPEACQTKEFEPFGLAGNIFIICTGAIAFLVILSSYIDRYDTNGLSPVIQKFLFCFSIKRNYNKLCTPHKDEDNLLVVHGFRYYSAITTVLVHALLLIFMIPQHSLQSVEEIMENRFIRLAVSLHAFIDFYFVFTAFLVTFLLLIDLNNKKPIDIPRMFIHRLARCLPLYILTILFYVGVVDKIGTGPIWKEAVKDHRDYCMENWWSTLLNINNYVDPGRICVLQTWAISAGMQMFLITPFLTILIFKRPKLGTVLLVLLIFIFTGITFFEIYYYKLAPIYQLINYGDLKIRFDDSFRYSYVPTHGRITPYLMGILTGYWRFRTKLTNFQFPSYIYRLGWVLSNCCIIATFYIANLSFANLPLGEITGAFYGSIYHLLVGYAMCWPIYAVSTGHGGIMERCFAKQSYVFYSKITFSVNMCNFAVLFFMASFIREPVYTSLPLIIILAYAMVRITYIVATIVHLFFEAPFINLERLIVCKHKVILNEQNSTRTKLN